MCFLDFLGVLVCHVTIWFYTISASRIVLLSVLFAYLLGLAEMDLQHLQSLLLEVRQAFFMIPEAYRVLFHRNVEEIVLLAERSHLPWYPLVLSRCKFSIYFLSFFYVVVIMPIMLRICWIWWSMLTSGMISQDSDSWNNFNWVLQRFNYEFS